MIKLSIGANIIDSPWGGGNKFAIVLGEFLKNKGWKVVTDLKDNDIDIVLMTEPRKYSASSNYNQFDISRYLIRNPNAIVIHRINNCNRSRNTRNLNRYLMRANKVADYTIFISNYLKKVYVNGNLFKGDNFKVIKNGADNKIFNKTGRVKWNRKKYLRIVTHHWSSNYNKGFDIYKELDEISLRPVCGRSIKFYYIGNIPKGFKFKNTTVIPPLNVRELVKEIKKNHIYVTGARGEGAGMHHIEAALCGLPILYRNDGALPEYCSGFGVMFNGKMDFIEKLKKIIGRYDYYFDRMNEYPYNAENMCKKYEKIFLELLNENKRKNLFLRRIKFIGIYIKEIFFSIVDIILFKLKRY